MHYNSWVP